jgi:hypothetical protein
MEERKCILHVVNRAQLGIDEHVQTPEQVVKKLAALPIEVLTVCLPPFFQFGSNSSPLGGFVMVEIGMADRSWSCGGVGRGGLIVHSLSR